MQVSQLPNIISGLRIALTVPIVWLLWHEQFGWGLLLFVVAGVSDGLDGYLAKRFGWESRLGGLLDPAADKFLLVASYVALGWRGYLPVWLVAAVILRDLVIVGGALIYHYRIARLEASPLLISKVNTFVQLLLVVAVIFDQALWSLPQVLLDGLVYVVLLTTVLSGVSYVREWSRRAQQRGA